MEAALIDADLNIDISMSKIVEIAEILIIRKGKTRIIVFIKTEKRTSTESIGKKIRSNFCSWERVKAYGSDVIRTFKREWMASSNS